MCLILRTQDRSAYGDPQNHTFPPSKKSKNLPKLTNLGLIPGVDFSYAIFADLPCRPTFLHKFEAKKLYVGEWQKWIKLTLLIFSSAPSSRNRPLKNLFSYGKLVNPVTCMLPVSCPT